ncbi:hypothetical protein [Methylophilus aquaticus]|uniref:Glycosyltransferase RgtA/B/C/D-like domain-containing protein n=1 Tax=Methylophilus aquaticus TaxID=1971610 RepID=A0ABT9JP63_9PROT|nr:hypothetical protein [Methylophilus aquaticus]MDP8566376.1 hypothetical protein [Methylophilus aquaticus]
MARRIGFKYGWSIVINLMILTVAAVLVSFVFNRMHVGVDLTDEGYYLNWISNPWLYKYYASQFGYIYHPLYQVLGGNVVYLRQANMLISLFLAMALACQLVAQYSPEYPLASKVVLSCCLALPALYILMIMGRWVPTPSYNSLNFQGCLIAVSGFVWSMQSHRRYWGAALIGLGGWLVFMAKPSTALFLSVITILYFSPGIRKDWPLVLIAGIVAIICLLLSGWWMDGNLAQFFLRFKGGLLLVELMGGDHSLANLFKLDLFDVTPLFKFQFSLTCAAIMLGLLMAQQISVWSKSLLQIIIIMIVAFALFRLLNHDVSAAKSNSYHTLIILALPFASFLFAQCYRKKCAFKVDFRLSALLIVMPYVYAVGTNNNYWQTAAGASVFWVLLCYLILQGKTISEQSHHLIASVVVCMSTIGVIAAMNTPYRQTQGLFSQTAVWTEPNAAQAMVLSDDTASYLQTLNQIATGNGFKKKTAVIDLTGHHPGALYFMQACAIGQAWTIGGYSGSERLAAVALQQASCDALASAWLLIEKHGRRAITDQILSAHGIAASKATYHVAGRLQTQRLTDWGAINVEHPDGVYTHYLVKPVDAARQAENCRQYRKAHSDPLLALIQ